jgi:hypothetical protein
MAFADLKAAMGPMERSKFVVEESLPSLAVQELYRTELLQQLERIVTSKHFRNSKRYPTLLRFVVEQTLAGHADSLKERTLGITVFDRPNDYDTNADPIVRVTAGEIRKRIAQYYQEPEHQHEWRIDLPLGSYVPHFGPSSSTSNIGFAEPVVEEGETRASISTPSPLERDLATLQAPATETISSRWQSLSLVAVVVILLMAVLLLAFRTPASRTMSPAISYFWKPLVSSRNPVLVVLGEHSLDRNGNDSPVIPDESPAEDRPKDMLSAMVRSNLVSLGDVTAYSRATDLLTQQSQLYRTKGANESTLEELRQGPVLLIGGLNNAWTLRLTAALRYRFFARDKLSSEIFDSKHPEMAWRFDNMQRTKGTSTDYAIVASYYDQSIAQRVLVIAGVGVAGTQAAAEFVTSNEEMQSWFSSVKTNQQNVELVLSTDIFNGQSGPPRVVATATW